MRRSEIRSKLSANAKPQRLRFGAVGFGRQSVLSAGKGLIVNKAITPLQRAASLVVGALLVGTAIALLNQANLGLPPYDVLISGVRNHTSLSFGQAVWAISGGFMAIAAMLGQRPSRWGLGYVLGVGFAVDAVSGLVNAPESLGVRIAFVFAAVAILASGISLVIHSGSTGGAFELLGRAGVARGLQARTVRTGLEIGVLSLGLLLGGRFGPATLVVAVSIGPALSVIGQALCDHSAGRQARRLGEAAETEMVSAPQS